MKSLLRSAIWRSWGSKYVNPRLAQGRVSVVRSTHNVVAPRKSSQAEFTQLTGYNYFTVPSRRFCTETILDNKENENEEQERSLENIETIKLVDPLTSHDFFEVREMVSIQKLFDARVHLGHKTGTQHALMRPYIFGNRLGVDVIDLDMTRELLGDALNVAANIAFRGGIILFLSRAKQTLPIVEKAAQDCGEYAHCRNFITGTFTNQENFFGIKSRLPDLAIFFSTHNHVYGQSLAVTECAKMNIPTIGIVDTNCDPKIITYPVPANDDTPCSVELLASLFAEAINRGKSKRLEFERVFEQLERQKEADEKTA